jgi:uncharacterized protein YceK
MRKIIIALVIGLALSGCSTIQKIENAYGIVTSSAVTPRDAYIAINAFDAAKASATHLILPLHLCNGHNAPCRAAGVRESVNKIISAGTVARNQVKAYMRANPGANITISSLADLRSATDNLQQIVSAYKSAQ